MILEEIAEYSLITMMIPRWIKVPKARILAGSQQVAARKNKINYIRSRLDRSYMS